MDTRNRAYQPPKEITFISDDTVATYNTTLPKSTHRKYVFYEYVYTVGGIKLGETLKLTEENLNFMKEKGYAKFKY